MIIDTHKEVSEIVSTLRSAIDELWEIDKLVSLKDRGFQYDIYQDEPYYEDDDGTINAHIGFHQTIVLDYLKQIEEKI